MPETAIPVAGAATRWGGAAMGAPVAMAPRAGMEVPADTVGMEWRGEAMVGRVGRGTMAAGAGAAETAATVELAGGMGGKAAMADEAELDIHLGKKYEQKYY